MQARINYLRNTTLTLIAMAFVAYLAVFGSESIPGALFFLPFPMTPLALIAYLALGWRSIGSQITFLTATIAYVAWFGYLYLYATRIHPDPQRPIVFLFVGIYAAPGLFLLWILAYAFEWRYRSR